MDNEELFSSDEVTPYDTLINLVNFSQQADQHITNLVRNQKQIINQYNLLKHELAETKMRLEAWEAVVNKLIEDVNDSEEY